MNQPVFSTADVNSACSQMSLGKLSQSLINCGFAGQKYCFELFFMVFLSAQQHFPHQ